MFIFCYRVTECGRRYIYTLSIREATCVVENDCSCESTTVKFASEAGVSYWDEEGGSKWPSMPTELTYNRIHKRNESSPYCIYALRHDTFVAASTLNNQDSHKFITETVVNKCIFNNYTQILEQAKEKAGQLESQLQLRAVVRMASIESVLSDLTTDALESGTQAIRPAIARLWNIVKTQHLTVDKEVQLNCWMNDILTKELRLYDFDVIKEFSTNKYSVFGGSQPDFAFYKHKEDSMLGAVVTIPQTESEENTSQDDIFCSTAVEFKLEVAEKNMYQCFGNMIRIANDRVIKSLKSGKLVKEITVYGLLVSHKELESTPIRYYSNFKDQPVIQVGVTGNFADCFYCILLS